MDFLVSVSWDPNGLPKNLAEETWAAIASRKIGLSRATSEILYANKMMPAQTGFFEALDKGLV
jgi:hypothetical protein